MSDITTEYFENLIEIKISILGGQKIRDIWVYPSGHIAPAKLSLDTPLKLEGDIRWFWEVV